MLLKLTEMPVSLANRGKHEAELTDLQRLHDEERQETEDAFQQEVLELQQEHEENMKKTNEETVKQKVNYISGTSNITTMITD